jgi:hypothetical protein
VESGKGITALTLNDAGGTCLSVKNTTTVISDSTVSRHCHPDFSVVALERGLVSGNNGN